MSYTHRIFVDESGDVGSSNIHMISAVVVTENHAGLMRLVRDTRREFRTLTRNKVLHAADDPPDVVKSLLNKLQAEEQLHLSVSIFDQNWWLNRSQGKKRAYQMIIAETVRHALVSGGIHQSQVEIVVERRFRSHVENERFKTLISEHLDIQVQQIEIVSKYVSKGNRGWVDHLSVADYVAWSYYQQYSKNDDQFVSIIDERVNVTHLGIDGSGVVRMLTEGKAGFVGK